MMGEKNRFGTATKAQNPPEKEFRRLDFAKSHQNAKKLRISVETKR